MDGADPEAFRAFRYFSHTFIHRWFKELLKPHMKKVPIVCTGKNGEVISQQIDPKKLTEVQSSRKKKRKNNALAKMAVQSVAFVNKNHMAQTDQRNQEITESIAAISLTDKDST